MTGLEAALLLGLLVLLVAVFYLVFKLQRLHSRVRSLKKLIQKLEGVREMPTPGDEEEMGEGA